ncbi:hypothetical protein CAC42_828 [Sphaceloma murrayae]|uniref:WHIM1 domain-containing protein n=1 Tax=Sphaceloma murrayae TaxID=2082308 RepID=A0A2K1QL32_9PEZI|nr:hypothetical protein CAC42_828 [Sphaceloma murrayae]
MDDSDSSSLSSALSSAPPSDDERLKLAPIFLKAKTNATKKKTKKKAAPEEPPASPPRPPRSPSPPHETSLADNPHIAFLVMFRSRFSSAFPPKLSHYGPQDVERGVEGSTPSPQVENLLCALLALVLNRKKPIERGHHGRALEEAIASQRAQWPASWNGINPLHGNRNFNTMSPDERLTLLHTLVIWSLSTSEAISQIIKDAYKQSRHEDDLNQPLSIQAWGMDGDKRRYYLIEGQDDTSFRLYRENPKYAVDNKWWNMAGSIDEIKAVAERLENKDTTQAARRLATKITAAVPRFEATEEKRKRREYRQIRRAQFSRPEPGFSMYEGRTRGKRLRYTFEDDDDFEDSDEFSVRRSGRHSDRSTPAEARGPVVTASGRQVKSREGGMYGESLLSNQISADDLASNDRDGSEASGQIRRASRSAPRIHHNGNPKKRKNIDAYNDVDEMSDEDEAASSAGWNSADNEDEAVNGGYGEDSENEISDRGEEEDDDEQSSLIVKLKVPSLDTLIITNAEEKKSAGDLRETIPVAQPSPEQIPRHHDRNTAMHGQTSAMDWTPQQRVDAEDAVLQDSTHAVAARKAEASTNHHVTKGEMIAEQSIIPNGVSASIHESAPASDNWQAQQLPNAMHPQVEHPTILGN